MILKLQNNSLELDKPLKLFDMKKFQQNVGRELKRAYPDRRKLEAQCISAVAFVRNEADILEQPCWVMLINVVAMDMLKSKIPPVKNDRSNVDIRTRPRIPIPDEDPYSIAGSRSSGSSGKHDKQRGDRPPKLPPRDTGGYGHPIPKPDYEGGGVMEESKFRQQLEQRNKTHQKKHDDPYYCGLRARIPNFAKSKSQKERESKYAMVGREIPGHPNVWHRGYDQGMMQGKGAMDPIYAGFSRTRPLDRNPTNRVPAGQQPGAFTEWESFWPK